MPADRIEIEEADEEGVIFKNLTNPIEVIKDENGHVKQVILQVMELGEPDASGRRAPRPVEGKTETHRYRYDDSGNRSGSGSKGL